jgi:S-adenosylmethionine decarboxylase proenzyme
MDTRARHLLAELHGCDRALLNDAARLQVILRQAAEAAGARVVAEVMHPYSPHGVTGVCVIEESHFSLHTWPESGYAAVDFYTCGEVSPERAAAVLGDALGAETVQLLLVERGRPLGEDPFRVRTLPRD